MVWLCCCFVLVDENRFVVRMVYCFILVMSLFECVGPIFICLV